MTLSLLISLAVVAITSAAVPKSGTLVMIGGWSSGTGGDTVDTVYRYSFADKKWSQGKPFPSGPSVGSADVQLDGKIYLIAGVNDRADFTNKTQIYDVATDTWSKGPTFPLAGEWMHGAVVGGKIYVIGAMTIGPEWQPNVYRLDGEKWTRMADMKKPARANYGIAVWQDRYIYIGAGYHDKMEKTTYRYDTQTDKWEKGTNLNGAGFDRATAIAGDKIYVVAGYDDDFGALDTEVGDLNENIKKTTYTIANNQLQYYDRDGHAVIHVGDKLWVIGDADYSTDPATPFPIEELDPATGEFTTIDEIEMIDGPMYAAIHYVE